MLDADSIVSLPKLKTHHWAGMTCSLKNLFGVVPGAIYGWPKNVLHFRGIDNSILDIAPTDPPQLAIVDAIVGMEGDGPIMGRAKPVGCSSWAPTWWRWTRRAPADGTEARLARVSAPGG